MGNAIVQNAMRVTAQLIVGKEEKAKVHIEKAVLVSKMASAASVVAGVAFIALGISSLLSGPGGFFIFMITVPVGFGLISCGVDAFRFAESVKGNIDEISGMHGFINGNDEGAIKTFWEMTTEKTFIVYDLLKVLQNVKFDLPKSKKENPSKSVYSQVVNDE